MALTENAKKWVAALRSGKYKQGQRRLQNERGEFCCLGVACEVAIENGVDVAKVVGNTGSVRYNDSASLPPRAVTEWLGLRTSDGSVAYGCGTSLVTKNDIEFRTFEQIANFIEREPAQLFKESDEQRVS